MVIIFATIMCISCPTDLWAPPHHHPASVLIWIGMWRIVLGVGVGGDYPMSSSVTSDRANLRKRGTLLAYVFANQGWGSLVGSIVTMITLLAFKDAIEHKGSKVDGSWRVIVGLSLIPAFGTLYQRLTLAESRRFKISQKARYDEHDFDFNKKHDDHKVEVKPASDSDSETTPHVPTAAPEEGLGAKHAVRQKKAHFRGPLLYTP